MFKAIRRTVKSWRRQRQFRYIKREFARCGYPLDYLENAEIEAALTGGDCRIEEVPLSAKTIYFTLRRLSTEGGKHFRKRKIKRAARAGESVTPLERSNLF